MLTKHELGARPQMDSVLFEYENYPESGTKELGPVYL